jgi:hypothetical protein
MNGSLEHGTARHFKHDAPRAIEPAALDADGLRPLSRDGRVTRLLTGLAESFGAVQDLTPQA